MKIEITIPKSEGMGCTDWHSLQTVWNMDTWDDGVTFIF